MHGRRLLLGVIGIDTIHMCEKYSQLLTQLPKLFTGAKMVPVNGISAPVNGISAPVNGMIAPVNGMIAPVNGISAPVNGIFHRTSFECGNREINVNVDKISCFLLFLPQLPTVYLTALHSWPDLGHGKMPPCLINQGPASKQARVPAVTARLMATSFSHAD